MRPQPFQLSHILDPESRISQRSSDVSTHAFHATKPRTLQTPQPRPVRAWAHLGVVRYAVPYAPYAGVRDHTRLHPRTITYRHGPPIGDWAISAHIFHTPPTPPRPRSGADLATPTLTHDAHARLARCWAVPDMRHSLEVECGDRPCACPALEAFCQNGGRCLPLIAQGASFHLLRPSPCRRAPTIRARRSSTGRR